MSAPGDSTSLSPSAWHKLYVGASERLLALSRTKTALQHPATGDLIKPTSAALPVFLALLHVAPIRSEPYRVQPSIKDLARLTGAHRSTILRALPLLEAAGLIAMTPGRRGNEPLEITLLGHPAGTHQTPANPPQSFEKPGRTPATTFPDGFQKPGRTRATTLMHTGDHLSGNGDRKPLPNNIPDTPNPHLQTSQSLSTCTSPENEEETPSTRALKTLLQRLGATPSCTGIVCATFTLAQTRAQLEKAAEQRVPGHELAEYLRKAALDVVLRTPNPKPESA